MSKLSVMVVEYEGSDEGVQAVLRAITEQFNTGRSRPGNDAISSVPAASADRMITEASSPDVLQRERAVLPESKPETSPATPAASTPPAVPTTPSQSSEKSPPAPRVAREGRALRQQSSALVRYELQDMPDKTFSIDELQLRTGAKKSAIWSAESAAKRDGKRWAKYKGVEFRRVENPAHVNTRDESGKQQPIPSATAAVISTAATTIAKSYEARPRHTGDVAPINPMRQSASEPPPAGPPTWHRKEADTVSSDPVTA